MPRATPDYASGIHRLLALRGFSVGFHFGFGSWLFSTFGSRSCCFVCCLGCSLFLSFIFSFGRCLFLGFGRFGFGLGIFHVSLGGRSNCCGCGSRRRGGRRLSECTGSEETGNQGSEQLVHEKTSFIRV